MKILFVILVVINAGYGSDQDCKCNDKGDKGDPGIPGARGPQGPPGNPGPSGYRGPHGDRGERGYRGPEGPRGDKGEKGDPGKDGSMGSTGEKGDTGERGPPGIEGPKGDPGPAGQTSMQSAHIVGTGNEVSSSPSAGDAYVVKSWKTQQISGGMTYDDKGHLTVNTDGVYFVYAQMFYYDGGSSYTGFNVYLDNKRILKTIYSIVDQYKKYHTQLTSGVFKIKKGQRIWVGTTIKRKYYFDEYSSFFGAYMIHP